MRLARLALEKSLPEHEGDRLRPTVHPELLEDPLRMRSGRLGGHKEPVRDLGLAHPLGEETEHLNLTPRQRCRALPERARPLDEPANARHELVERERLDKIIVPAHEKAGDLIERLGPLARDEHDRQHVAELLTQRAAHLVPTRSRQRDLQDHHPRRLVTYLGERVFPARRFARRVAHVAEGVGDHLANRFVRIDDEDWTGRSRRPQHRARWLLQER
jgi:hypothetical protein